MKQALSFFAIRYVTATAILLAAFAVHAGEDRLELGLGSGQSNVIESAALKSAASKGDNQSYWLGYGLDPNWALEVSLDHFDFDTISSDHETMNAAAVYRFTPERMFHPLVKFGLGTVTTKAVTGDKTNSFGAKVMLGFEAECKYVSVGAGINYHYISRIGDTDSLKNTQVYVPMLFISFHYDSAESQTYSPNSNLNVNQ
jgi:Outer membrane protein beta-barrel domain